MTMRTAFICPRTWSSRRWPAQ